MTNAAAPALQLHMGQSCRERERSVIFSRKDTFYFLQMKICMTHLEALIKKQLSFTTANLPAICLSTFIL